MKKVLMILGVVFLVGVGGFIAILVWAHAAGSAKQEAFFKAVGSGDPQQVLELFHPALREQFDAPVLAEWMKAFNESLGEFKGLSSSGFSTSTKTTDAGTETESEGTVNFEKGLAQSRSVFLDGLITEFKVESEALAGVDWFANGPSDTALYRQRGEQMLRLFLTGDAAGAHAMFHESYQEDFPLAEVEQQAASAAGALGAVQSIEVTSDEFKKIGAAQVLTVFYDVTCANGAPKASVTFRFIELKGYIVEFKMR
ncbi:MAG: hypothetical protein ACYTFO_05575 [Planctomycetota bacterium]|jgi:hypothetical protein